MTDPDKKQPERVNGLHRAVQLLEKARDRGRDGRPVWHNWATILDVPLLPDVEAQAQVARVLVDLTENMRQAQTALGKTTLPLKHYEHAFQHSHQVFSVVTIGAPWVSVHERISQHMIDTLALCADRLVTTEEVIPQSDLDSVRVKIIELRKDVDAGDLPDAVKSFVLAQLLELEMALLRYQATGAIDLFLSGTRVRSEGFFHRDLLRGHLDSPIIKRMVEIAGMVALVAATTISAAGAMKGAQDIGQVTGETWVAYQRRLGGGNLAESPDAEK